MKNLPRKVRVLLRYARRYHKRVRRFASIVLSILLVIRPYLSAMEALWRWSGLA